MQPKSARRVSVLFKAVVPARSPILLESHCTKSVCVRQIEHIKKKKRTQSWVGKEGRVDLGGVGGE